MEHLEGILKLVDNELEAIEKNGKFRSREEIDSVYKLVDIAKDAYCIWKYEEEDMDGESYDDGMSYERGGNRGGRSYRGGSYDGSYDGGSYARGRGRNARRDSMGRYSRDMDSRPMRGYSRDDQEGYKEHLMTAMENAPDEQTRQNIKRMLDTM